MPKPHPYDWLIEPLAEDPGFARKAMFGAVGCYLRGKMVCALAAKEEPWRGLLVALERAQHESVRAEFPALTPHPVLSKWLYLPEEHDAFESVATAIIEAIRQGDERFGVIPPPRKSRTKKRPNSRP